MDPSFLFADATGRHPRLSNALTTSYARYLPEHASDEQTCGLMDAAFGDRSRAAAVETGRWRTCTDVARTSCVSQRAAGDIGSNDI